MILRARLPLTKKGAEELFGVLRYTMKMLDSDKRQLSEKLKQALSANNKTIHRGELHETSALYAGLLDQMCALQMKWKALKRLDGKIVKGVETERLKGTLPAGTTCRFCPIA